MTHNERCRRRIALLAVLAGAVQPTLGQATAAGGSTAGQDTVQTGEQPEGAGAEGLDAQNRDRQPDRGEPVPPRVQDDMVSFSAFSEPLNLVDLIDMVASILGINVNIDPSVSGEVMFNSGFTVPRDQLLGMLSSLLEQNGYIIMQDPRTGFYSVLPDAAVRVEFEPGASDLATTRLIPTDSVRPSALSDTINSMLGISGGPGVAADRIAYLDDASLIAVTGSPGRIAQVQSIVDAVLAEYLSMQFVRFELVNIAAPVARNYIISVVTGEEIESQPGQLAGAGRPGQGAPGQVPGLVGGGTLDSIPDRLRVDPVGNALLFRGRPEELSYVQSLIALIDKPSTLSHKRFFTGSATMSVAQFASSQGLGEVVSFDQFQGQQGGVGVPGRNINPQNLQTTEPIRTRGGPVLVVDEQRGFIIHYATTAQHDALEQLVEQLDAPSEEIVIRAYKLEHAVASEVADLLTGILQNQRVQRDDQGSLLPQNQGGGGLQGQQTRRPTPLDPNRENQEPGEIFVEEADEIFVVADEAHNQVLVKASIRQQREIAKLIEKVDLRQAQVYLDVKIVSISDTDTFRLAVETQLINANGQPVGQTNFGLTSPGEGGILDPRIVSPGLGGLTTAVILSDYVPFVLNAIQTVTDAKVLANPTLLVNDNADGRIDDLRQEPFTVRTIGEGGVERTSTEFAEAGTTVEVTPRISSGGYLTLEYRVLFSNFIGEGSGDQPPPINQREVNSIASLPTDSTMILGGITVDNLVNTVVKVPLIGDIPLFGHLFRDTSRTKTDTLLYIFITPRILRERTFAGHRLISEGPMKIADIAPDAPALEPVLIPILERRARVAAENASQRSDDTPPAGDGDG